MHAANNLKQFLRNHHYSNGSNSLITHTRIGSKDKTIAGGSYSISNDEMSQFWSIYYKHVFVDCNPEYLTETQLKDGNGPILIDIDFRYNFDVQERQHNDEHIQSIFELYIEKINEIKEFTSLQECEFPIYIFQKPDVNTSCNEEGITKDGIHIIIGIKMNHQEQLLLRNKIKEEINDIIEDLPFINTIDDINIINTTKFS